TAVTLHNLGKAYAFRAHGAQRPNFLASRDAFERAGVIFVRLGEITKARLAYTSAGGIDYELEEWSKASLHFDTAIELLEQEWRNRLTAQYRLRLTREGAKVFDIAVLAAIKAEDWRRAFSVLERGRHKLFVETYFSKHTQAFPG